MFDQLNFIQIAGLFIVPIVVLLGAIWGPKQLRHSLWGGIIILLTFYFVKFF